MVLAAQGQSQHARPRTDLRLRHLVHDRDAAAADAVPVQLREQLTISPEPGAARDGEVGLHAIHLDTQAALHVVERELDDKAARGNDVAQAGELIRLRKGRTDPSVKSGTAESEGGQPGARQAWRHGNGDMVFDPTPTYVPHLRSCTIAILDARFARIHVEEDVDQLALAFCHLDAASEPLAKWTARLMSCLSCSYWMVPRSLGF